MDFVGRNACYLFADSRVVQISFEGIRMAEKWDDGLCEQTERLLGRVTPWVWCPTEFYLTVHASSRRYDLWSLRQEWHRLGRPPIPTTVPKVLEDVVEIADWLHMTST